MNDLNFEVALGGHILKAQWEKFSQDSFRALAGTGVKPKEPDVGMEVYWARVRQELRRAASPLPESLRWFTYGRSQDLDVYLVTPSQTVLWLGCALIGTYAEDALENSERTRKGPA